MALYLVHFKFNVLLFGLQTSNRSSAPYYLKRDFIKCKIVFRDHHQLHLHVLPNLASELSLVISASEKVGGYPNKPKSSNIEFLEEWPEQTLADTRVW